MATILRGAAANVINKGPPSSFYDSPGKPNPVFQALDQEIKSYNAYMKKRSLQGYIPQQDEAHSRPADTLFDLWNKYEPRLPSLYYEEKLLEMGDNLVALKEYNLALWQCYVRYLKRFGDVNVEEIVDVEKFKETYFPDGFEMENAGLTFRALMGKSICQYQVIRLSDPKLQNKESIDDSIRLLSFLRLVTQVVLPQEKLCWLVFNGTVHIYSVSRHLMSLGHSSKVLEYLLWACLCMETSVPLLAVHYLQWRSTLYTAVCQCYFDCKQGQHAEAFARRGLSKINELSQLECVSSSKEDVNTELSFRQATIRMAVMMFKRSAFETRKKPKGILRPKQRANLKDAQGLPWPRTPSEKMLAEMFEGSASQFLCIIETLTDSNRRTLVTSPPAPDSEVEILDVFAELFLAAQEILAGGGGNTQQTVMQQGNSINTNRLSAVIEGRSLIQMATQGEDGVPIGAVVKLIKLAYCYEHWELYDVIIDPVLYQLKEIGEEKYGPDIKALELILAMEKVNPNRKHCKRIVQDDSNFVEKEPKTAGIEPYEKDDKQGSVKSQPLGDDLLNLGEVLLSITNGPYSQELIDMDMMMDAVLFLWNKCKAVFQKYQTGSIDNTRFLQRMENPSKWVSILHTVHQVLGWCEMNIIDPALTAEVALRLALVIESSALDKGKKKGRRTVPEVDFEEDTARDAAASISGQNINITILNRTELELLVEARDILELGLFNVSIAREATALTDGKSIADIEWVQDLNTDLFKPMTGEDESHENLDNLDLAAQNERLKQSDATAVWNTVKDLHLELIFIYHRVCLKLSQLGEDSNSKKHTQLKRRKRPQDYPIVSFDELVLQCNKSLISKALLNMQRALMLGSDKNVTKEQSALLGDALNMIVKTETSERNLYIENMIDIDKKLNPKSKVPPSPILLSRTDTKMVFKPGPFEPVNQKVAWYRLFGRPSRGSNIKVRLNDYFLPGTGQQIPSFRCELSVSGLQPGEQYVFAVAAYTAEGKLIGESIGETSKPILASHPLPVLMTWAYLSQVGYQVGCNDIAQRACEVLWNHFVGVRPPPDADIYITSKDVDTSLTLYKLNKRVISLASPVLLRQFLTSIFINVDIDVRQGLLFCDTLCDQGPLHNGQMSRLRECERMLVAIELAGWLNEANLALQAIVQCYGLTAPLIQFKIPSLAVIQILQYCLAVLLEIPVALRQRRQASISESLHHMTACMTYHMAKVLRTWGQRQLANHMNDNGRRLLAIESTDSSPQKQSDKPVQANATPAEENAEETAPPEIGALTLAGLKKRKGRNKIFGGKDDADGPNNEELKALEAHILRLSRQAQSEHELIGNEDPSILYAYIAYLPSRIAYKEVVKFKRRARYIEFFVQVAVKALAEGLASSALDWCEETAQWLNKRNDQIIGPKVVINKQPGAVTVGATDDAKKYAVTMVEFNKEKPQGDVTPKAKPSKTKNKPKNAKTDQHVKLWKSIISQTALPTPEQEETIHRAMEVLTNYLPDIVHSYLRRKKLRKVCVDEMPWRAQLNNLQGLSQFGVFMQKLELMEKMGGNMNSNSYRTSFLDLEWFTLETTGTLIVGWDGGPSRQATKMDLYTDDVPHIIPKKTKGSVGKLSDGPVKMSAVERAAAISTGILPPAAFPVIEEGEETPRTYRSEETVSMPRSRKADPKIDMDAINILTPKSAETMLKKTFNFFQRSIVLAHRGKHWTSLQNACRGLWNCAHNALLRTAQSSQNPTGLLTFQALRLIVLPAFYTAADCLLEMLVTLQNDMEEEAAKPRNRRRSVVVIETWMGGIADEKGGASLKFEKQLDDISIVDTRWVRRIVLRVLELLSFERKWEKLVDLALRFNAVTYDRYATQVCPLLIHAQHKLIDQVNTYGGEEPPQSHYQYVETQINGPVTSRNYQDIQLKASCVLEKLSFSLDPGAQLDPDNYDLYDGAVSAKKNIRVPLDIDGSLNELCTALDKSQYTARALQHSRKLLVLYLAGQQNASQDNDLPREVSKVDFAVPVTARPQLTMPPDLKVEDFMKMDDVQNAPLPKTQIGVVVASYIKTIELLKAKNQKSVAAQAMHELANLYYHAGNIKGAYQWWSDSLDIIMNITDSLHKWRDLVTGDKNKDISTILQERYGLWGCLLAGVLSSKIAQYVLTSDLGLRMETCFLSGYCFKALFRASLPHPIADRDYALYDIGEGCEVTNLVPGIDLFSDRFRCDGRTVVAALRWVTEELARGRHNLFVLPLLSLNQYFTTFVCRDLQRSVDGRILKVRVLTDLGLFTEAFIILMRLLHGERLPQTVDSNFRQMESKMSHNTFCTSKPVLDPKNLQVLENAIDKRLSSNLGTLYGPHLTCRLSIVQAHLLNAVAQTIPVIPDFTAVVLPSGPTVKGTSVSMDSVGVRFGSKRSKPATVTSQKPKKDDAVIVKGDSDSDDSKEGTEKRFSPRDKKLSMEYVKGTLLGAADKMMTAISEIILESAEMDQGTENIPAAELELVVLAKLELADVARQRHHASMAARCVLAAMKLLQNSEVYREKSEIGRFDTVAARNSSLKGGRTEKTSKVQIKETETTMFQYQNFQSRARLDTRLWLDCRLSLVESLMCELRGMGEIKGPERAVKVELADCRLYCAEGVAEAEAVGDTEMLAEFLMQAALLDIMEGKSIDSTEEILQEILKILSGVLWLSPSGQLLRVTAMIQLIDLVAAGKSSSDEPITEKTLLDYLNAQKLLLDQFHLFGEKVEHHNAIGRQIRSQRDGPVSPMQNIYLRHVALLIQVKLRIGHAMARNVTRYSKKHGSADAAERWTEVLGVLSSALELNKISARRTAHLEAVILLNIGKVQRQLCSLGSYQHRAVASTFLDAIKISHAGSHDLGLIRQAYLEIALVYLSNTGMMGRDGSPDPTSGAESETDAGSTSPTLKRRGKRPTRRSKQKPKEESEMDKEKRAAWLSIRCAAAVGQSMRSRSVLTGDVTVSSVLVDANSQSTMPEFAVLDLISSYVLGEKKIVFKNEIEEELSTMPEAQDPKIIESYEEQVQRARESAADISWVHLLGYQSLLQRICSTATVSLSNNHVGDVQKPASDDNAEQFDLGFVVHSETEYTPNHDVVRIPLHSDTWAIRLNHMHRYFTENLPVYKATCVAVYPPAGLILPLIDSTATATTELPIFIRKYPDNMLTLELQPDGSFPEQPLPPGLNPEPHKPSDKEITTPSKSDLIVQWYQPVMQELEVFNTELNRAEQKLMMFYSVNKKNPRSSSNLAETVQLSCNMMWISLSQILELHDRLTLLAQRAEISLADPPSKQTKPRPDSVQSVTGQPRTRKGQRIKALSATEKKDDQLEAFLRQCLTDIQTLFGVVLEKSEPEDVASQTALSEEGPPSIPFEMTKSNVSSIEKLFNPNYGFILNNRDMFKWFSMIFTNIS